MNESQLKVRSSYAWILFFYSLYVFFSLSVDQDLSAFFSFISGLFFFGFMFLFFLNEKAFFVHSFSLLLPYSWAFVSLLFIEKGVYMSEIRQFGSYEYGSTIFSIFLITGFFSAYVGFNFLRCYFPEKKWCFNKFKNSSNYYFFKVGAFFLVLGLLCLGGISGFPLLENIDRNIFWNSQSLQGQRQLFNQLPLLSLVIGLLLVHEKIVYKNAVILLVVCLALSILYGEKFTGIFSIIYAFFLVVVSSGIFSIKDSKNIFILISFVFFVLVFLLVFKYIYSADWDVRLGFENLSNRAFNLQGQLWWAVSQAFNTNGSIGNWHLDGMDVLMKYFAPDDVYKSYVSRGVNFTMAYPAFFLFCFGWLGLVINAVIFFVFGVFSFLFHYAIKTGKFFLCIILYKLYNVIYVALNNSDFVFVESASFYFYLSFLLAYLFFFSKGLSRD